LPGSPLSGSALGSVGTTDRDPRQFLDHITRLDARAIGWWSAADCRQI